MCHTETRLIPGLSGKIYSGIRGRLAKMMDIQVYVNKWLQYQKHCYANFNHLGHKTFHPEEFYVNPFLITLFIYFATIFPSSAGPNNPMENNPPKIMILFQQWIYFELNFTYLVKQDHLSWSVKKTDTEMCSHFVKLSGLYPTLRLILCP